MRFIKHFRTLQPEGLNDRFDPYNDNDSVLPIIIPFSNSSYKFTEGLKNLASSHNVSNTRIITAYKRSKNLKEAFNAKL